MSTLKDKEMREKMYTLKQRNNYYSIRDPTDDKKFINYNVNKNTIIKTELFGAPVFVGRSVEEFEEYKKEFSDFLKIYDPKKNPAHHCYSCVEVARDIINKTNNKNLKKPIEKIEFVEYQLLQSAIHGGMYHHDKAINYKGFTTYDINSSYPYALSKLKMIYNAPILQTEEFTNNFCFNTCIDPCGLYDITILNNRDFPFIKKNGVYTHFNLFGFNNIGITYKINKIWLYKQYEEEKPKNDPYKVNELGKHIKTLYEMKKNNIHRDIAKKILNTLYGECVRVNIKTIDTDNYDDEKHKIIHFTPEYCDVVNRNETELYKYNSFGRMHAFILGFGFYELTKYIKIIQDNKGFISSIRTDSIETNIKIDKKHIGHEIGQLKEEQKNRWEKDEEIKNTLEMKNKN